MVNAHEVARKSGLSLGQVISLRLALGFAVTDPGALELPESVIEDVGLFKFAIDHFGEERALALARVIGDGVARIVEATRAAFSASVVEASMTELEISLRNETTNAGWLPLEAAVGHLLREWSGRGYEFFAAILDGDAVLAVGFVDLVGSTAWTMAARPAEHTAALMRLERLRGRAQSRRAAA